MKEIIDVIAIILFVFILFIVIAGFNRQMVAKNKERARVANERENMKKINKETKEGKRR